MSDSAIADDTITMTRAEFDAVILRAVDEARRSRWSGFLAGLVVLFVGLMLCGLIVRDQVRAVTADLRRELDAVRDELLVLRGDRPMVETLSDDELLSDGGFGSRAGGDGLGNGALPHGGGNDQGSRTYEASVERSVDSNVDDSSVDDSNWANGSEAGDELSGDADWLAPGMDRGYGGVDSEATSRVVPEPDGMHVADPVEIHLGPPSSSRRSADDGVSVEMFEPSPPRRIQRGVSVPPTIERTPIEREPVSPDDRVGLSRSRRAMAVSFAPRRRPSADIVQIKATDEPQAVATPAFRSYR